MIVTVGGDKLKGRPNVFLVKFRVRAKKFRANRISRNGRHDSSNRQPEVADAWLTVELLKIPGD